MSAWTTVHQTVRIAVWTGDTRDTRPKAELGIRLFDHFIGAHEQRRWDF